MTRTKLEEIIESFEIGGFSQFFRLKTRAEGNFRPSEERLSQYDDTDFLDFVNIGQIEFSGSQRMLVAGAKVIRDLSERSGKKAQYEKAKRMLRELSAYSAGIFIFYDKNGHFRFSLVYPESIGTKREWSNFRRYTYFVSKELTNKTFLQRVGDGDFSTLEKIKDAFSVEKVTKEFYLEYRKLFDSLMEALSKNHTFLNEASKYYINTENFAKKLLGQIVFLYFIQKKGWLGVLAGKKWGEGDKNFMGNIYKAAMSKKANFYNDYLEKLFYNALNNAHRDSADPSFSKDFNSRIPFLNGGLFEAEYDWKNSLMCLDNKIFQSIFDVFERYNFTVEEESPDDKEIAVDPEMLGKVFENLLPENLRKGKGTYYTPREIVYYMCRESLINYLSNNSSDQKYLLKIKKFVNRETEITKEELIKVNSKKAAENAAEKVLIFTKEEARKIDDLLQDIRICDPACGSGAFLIGMLNEIVRMRKFLDDWYFDKRISEYEFKKETIQNCIYGVDIDPGAVEIAKLRLWLSLVVDYNIEDIEPLPNLDYKIMQGNSLLEDLVLGDTAIKLFDSNLIKGERKKMKNLFEEETQRDLFEKDSPVKKIVGQLDKLRKEYFGVSDLTEKLKLRKEIEGIEQNLVEQCVNREIKNLEVQLKNIGKYLAPGIGLTKEDAQKIAKIASLQDQIMQLWREFKESGVRPFFLWHLYFADIFQQKNGFDVVIANPPWVFSRLGKFTAAEKKYYSQKYIGAKGKINLYSLFINRGFEIIRDGGFATMIIPNTFIRASVYEVLRRYLLSSSRIINITDTGAKVFGGVTASTIIFLLSKTSPGKNIPIIKFSENKIPLYLGSVSIKDILNSGAGVINIYAGNCEQIIKRKIWMKAYPLSKFVENLISGIQTWKKNKSNFISNKPLTNEYKPLIEGKDISNYRVNFSEKYIWYSKKVLNVMQDENIFLSPQKIVIQRVGGGNRPIKAALDKNKYYCFNSLNTLVCKKIDHLFILAILNSKITNWYYSNFFSNNSLLTVNISTKLLRQLPIVKIESKNDENIKHKIIKSVDKILAITKTNDYLENSAQQAKVKEYEKQIDQLVYKLYGLTPEEIKIVEKELIKK